MGAGLHGIGDMFVIDHAKCSDPEGWLVAKQYCGTWLEAILRCEVSWDIYAISQ
jgi:hypothetical protein